ncbi:hypothetical protein I4U23_005279 [Adineta vaga]|nr:hypothetical protein I4U23_005279 [Adineta vaga]
MSTYLILIIFLIGLSNASAATICSWNQQLCNRRCYTPGLSQCINEVICNWDQQLCNGRCYTPGQSQCLGG